MYIDKHLSCVYSSPIEEESDNTINGDKFIIFAVDDKIIKKIFDTKQKQIESIELLIRKHYKLETALNIILDISNQPITRVCRQSL